MNIYNDYYWEIYLEWDIYLSLYFNNLYKNYIKIDETYKTLKTNTNKNIILEKYEETNTLIPQNIKNDIKNDIKSLSYLLTHLDNDCFEHSNILHICFILNLSLFLR